MIPIRCIFGMAEHGKTTLARQLVKGEGRLLAWDPDEEHEVAHLSYEDACQRIDADPSTFRIALTDYDEFAPEDLCTLIWELALRESELPEAQRRPLLALFEEAEEVAPVWYQQPVVRNVIRRGRHHRVAILACSRRPGEVAHRISSQAHEMYLFAMNDPGSLTYLRQSGIGPDVADVVEQLPQFEYVHWTRGGAWKRLTLPPPANVPTTSHRGPEPENSLDDDQSAM